MGVHCVSVVLYNFPTDLAFEWLAFCLASPILLFIISVRYFMLVLYVTIKGAIVVEDPGTHCTCERLAFCLASPILLFIISVRYFMLVLYVTIKGAIVVEDPGTHCTCKETGRAPGQGNFLIG